jgi:hypothetical protein
MKRGIPYRLHFSPGPQAKCIFTAQIAEIAEGKIEIAFLRALCDLCGKNPAFHSSA